MLVLLEQQRRAKHHGGVHVMAAGMHDPSVFRAKRHAAGLVDRQRIDITAQSNYFFAAANLYHHAGGQIVRQQSQPGVFQPLADPPRCLKLLKRQLRVLMKLASPLNQLL